VAVSEEFGRCGAVLAARFGSLARRAALFLGLGAALLGAAFFLAAALLAVGLLDRRPS